MTHDAGAADAPFTPGQTIIRRDMFAGRAWSATPVRVISNTAKALLVSHWPGVRLLSPQRYIDALESGLLSDRMRLIREIALGHWDLGERQWRDTVLRLLASRQGPFAGNWSVWRRDPQWPAPVLPDTAGLI